MAPTPSLDELATAPERARQLPPEVRQALVLKCAAALVALASVAPELANERVSEAMPEELLDVRAAARRLGTSTDWLYRRARSLPFTVRLPGGRLRFSVAGLARYIRARQGR